MTAPGLFLPFVTSLLPRQKQAAVTYLPLQSSPSESHSPFFRLSGELYHTGCLVSSAASAYLLVSGPQSRFNLKGNLMQYRVTFNFATGACS